MEVWEIVGIEQNAKFKGDNGELIAGIRLHLVGECEFGSSVIGMQVRNQFISNQTVQKHQIQVQPGNTIKFEFNRYGNICRVEVS